MVHWSGGSCPPVPRSTCLPRAAVIYATAAIAMLACASVGFAQDSTQAGVSVRLTYSAGARPGVVVLPIAGALGDSIRAMVARDLDNGDRVSLITPPTAGAGAPSGRGVDYPSAKVLGAAAVVEIVVTAPQTLRITVHDVARARVLGVQYATLAGTTMDHAWRMSVHRASDEIERTITGVRGVAATQVLFVRDQRIWAVDADGAFQRALTERTSLSPAWHPAGDAFVYGALNDRGQQRIVTHSLSAREVGRTLASGGVVNITPTVSPDGEVVMYAHGSGEGVDLFAVPWTGGTGRRVTVGRGSLNVSPSFSPDGRRIAFTSGRTGHPEIYIADADGTSVELLTMQDPSPQNYRANPAWSPDGRLVAYQARTGNGFEVHVLDVRTKSVRRFTTGSGDYEDPTWAPDSRHLAVTSNQGGHRQLMVLDVETGRARQLTRGLGGARMPAWSPALAAAPPR